MKNKFKFFSRLIPLLVLLLMLPTAVWGVEGDVYHVCSMSNYTSGTRTTEYSSSSELVIAKNTNSVTWVCTGNQQSTQFRFGGNKITAVDRGVYSTTAINVPIKEISVEHANVSSSSITVNSITLTISSKSDFSAIVYTNTITPSQNKKEITPSPIEWSGNWASGLYYKIMVNVTNTSSSNYYFGVNAIKFYEGASSSDPAINASDVTIEADATSGEIAYTISNPVDDVNPTATLTSGDWISDVQVDAANKKVTFVATGNATAAARTATIKISYTGAEDKTVTITQKKPVVTTAYNKVTASTMVIGGTYVWYAANKVAAPMSGSNMFFATADATIENEQVKISSEVAPQLFIFSHTANGWTIQNENSKYLQVSGDKQLSWIDGSVTWVMEGTTNPTFKSYRVNTTDYYKMQFNSDRFNVYTSSQTAATLYHLASESAHTLSLNPNYGEEESVDYLVVDGYSWIPIAPSRSDYEFLGWATTAEGEVAYAPDAAYTMPACASELFAVWEAISADPEVIPSSTSVNVTSDKYATGTATFSITGRNLSRNLSLELADAVAGLTVNPTSITISSSTLSETTITISYVSEEAVSSSVNLYVKQGEDVLATIAVNYTSTSPITEITDVTGAMTWDFSGYTKTVEFTTTEDKAREVVLGNFVTLTTGDENALKGVQQYIVRSEYCWQGSKLTFHPTVQGVVEIVWSSTSGSNVRTLDVNGTKAIPAGSKKANKSNKPEDNEVSTFNVSANEDVVLAGWDVKNAASDGYVQEGNYYYKSNMIRIWKITFTPTYSEEKSLSLVAYDSKSNYYATFSSDKVTFWPEWDDDVTYLTEVQTVNVLDNMMSMTTLDEAKGIDGITGYFVPANTGVLVKVEFAGNAENTVPYYEVSNKVVGALEDNLLMPGTGSKTTANVDSKFYRLAYANYNAKTGLGFYYGQNCQNGEAFTCKVGSAYLAVPVAAGAPTHFVFGDWASNPNVTGVEQTSLVNDKKMLINNRLVIVRGNRMFDVNGCLVK